jgi:hypothetical protein
MATLFTALLLLGPKFVVESSAVDENRCYTMRIFPIPKDFRDPIALPAGPPPAKLEEVRPNCWAQPSTQLVPARSQRNSTQKH